MWRFCVNDHLTGTNGTYLGMNVSPLIELIVETEKEWETKGVQSLWQNIWLQPQLTIRPWVAQAFCLICFGMGVSKGFRRSKLKRAGELLFKLHQGGKQTVAFFCKPPLTHTSVAEGLFRILHLFLKSPLSPCFFLFFSRQPVDTCWGCQPRVVPSLKPSHPRHGGPRSPWPVED